MANHKHEGEQCHCGHSSRSAAVAQHLDEMEFERGIWSAALYNDLPRLRHHIARGDTTRTDHFGYTALHYAARHADGVAACRLLLDAGCPIEARTAAGGVTALHRAAAAGRADCVRLLLERGAAGGVCDADGQTALHRAADGGHVRVCEMLCERDDDGGWRAQRNRRGQRPADLVAVQRRREFGAVFVWEPDEDAAPLVVR